MHAYVYFEVFKFIYWLVGPPRVHIPEARCARLRIFCVVPLYEARYTLYTHSTRVHIHFMYHISGDMSYGVYIICNPTAGYRKSLWDFINYRPLVTIYACYTLDKTK